jgi:hypothetical protein
MVKPNNYVVGSYLESIAELLTELRNRKKIL